MGLADVEERPIAEAAPGTMVRSWSTMVGADDKRSEWSDVYKVIEREEFERDYQAFFDGLATYAGLDDAGWVEPGKMGWWGVANTEPDGEREHRNGFRKRFIEACGPDDLLVAVDCHI